MKVQQSKSIVKPRFYSACFNNQNIHQEVLKRESFRRYTLMDVPYSTDQLFGAVNNEEAYFIAKRNQQNLNQYCKNQYLTNRPSTNQSQISGSSVQDFLSTFEGVRK